MSCGLSEEELAALEAEAAERRDAAGTCSTSGKPCAATGCGNKDEKGKAGVCRKGGATDGTPGSWRCGDAPSNGSVCMKCKSSTAVVLVRQREPLCQACLEAGVSGKVRALKTHKLLLPNDHIAVAFSGGSCSQALLCSVLPMRKDAHTPRKERGKIEFELSVIHINEAAAYGLDPQAAAAHGAAVAAAAAACGAVPPAASLHVVPLSDVFLLPPEEAGCSAQRHGTGGTGGTDAGTHGGSQPGADAGAEHLDADAAAAAAAREARLCALLQSVPDPTGREDLLAALRARLLAATAASLGASKVLRGDSASTLAARVIADTAKGRGYALPADIQLVDARGRGAGEPALLYPMREVTLKEAVFMCRLRGLRPAALPLLSPASAASGSRRSINDLAHSFISGLQANLPSTVFTVLRTASALKPFPFNAIDTTAQPTLAQAAAAAGRAAAAAAAPSEAGPAGSGNGAGGSRQAVACCVLCRAPLTQREREAIQAARAEATVDARAQSRAGEAVSRGSGWRHGGGAVGQEQGSSAGTSGPAAAGMQEDDCGDEDDAAAPFCTSCKGQILFAPGQAAVVGGTNARLHTGPGSARPCGHVSGSKVFPLLPAALRDVAS